MRPPNPAANAAGARTDALMERASDALVKTDYFEAAALAERALTQARAAEDCDRAARICLPLQEARRQIRQLATDAAVAAEARGEPAVRVAASRDDIRTFSDGCYLIQPPLIGADARALRAAADRRRVPLFLLTREPLTRAGEWPVVAVGAVSVRTRLAPPFELERVDARVSKDAFDGRDPAGPRVPLRWFEAAAEALGDAAIAALKPDHSPWWHIDDLIEAIGAIPDHEKLYQRLARAFREAEGTAPPLERRPGPLDDPTSF